MLRRGATEVEVREDMARVEDMAANSRIIVSKVNIVFINVSSLKVDGRDLARANIVVC